MRDACQSSSVVTIPAIIARIRSASPRWLPSKRAGRWTLRISTAPITPASTSTANTSTSSANQPWWPSHGSVASRSTAPIIAITIVGNRTRKPQKIAAWIRPGTRRWSSLRWPSTISASLRAPLRQVVEARRSACPSAPGRRAAAPGARTGMPLTASAAASASAPASTVYGERAFLSSAVIAGHDLGQVADHRVVGAGEDRRLGVGVDREDLLRALAAGDVLGRAADAAGDVEVGRHLRAGLADLVGVRAPAGAGHDARAADRGVQQPGQLLEDPEAVRRADAAAAADHDLGLGQRHAGGRPRPRARRPARPGRRRRAPGRRSRPPASRRPRPPAQRVRRDRQQRQRRVDARLLEQAAAPADAGDRVAVDGGAVGRERQVAPGGQVRQHLVASVRSRRRRRRLAATRSITSSRAVAHAPGAYASSPSATCARSTGRPRRRLRRAAPRRRRARPRT